MALYALIWHCAIEYTKLNTSITPLNDSINKSELHMWYVQYCFRFLAKIEKHQK